MLGRQRGMTFLGWMLILIPLALVLYAAIRLMPVYLEHMKIERTLVQLHESFKGQQPDAALIRTAIERRFDIEGVNVISVRDAERLRIRRENEGYKVQAVYSHSVPLFGNIYLRVDFDDTVVIK